QERISRLAANTRGTKDRLPGEFQSAFEQIEEAMEQLAARIQNSAPGSHANAPIDRQDDLSGIAAHGNANDLAALQPGDDQKRLATLANHFLAQSQATHSEPGDIAAVTDPAAPAEAAEITTEQPIAEFQAAGNPDDPWDETTAEQLTQLYESGEAGIPHSVDQSVQLASSPIAQPQTQQLPIVQVDNSEQRAWLTENFNRIIAQIETSAVTDPENEVDHIELLGERLDQMEFRLQGAMEALPTNTDMAALQDIESCIVEFTAQLERSQGELERIAQVETLVQELAERLSDERLTELVKQPELPEPKIDSEQIADLVAQQVSEVAASKLISAIPEPQQIDTEELSEVKGLVNNLIAEQRNGGRQTTERLDILQQATLQLLERLEKVETTQEDIAKDVASRPVTSVAAQAAMAPNETAAQQENAAAPAGRTMQSLNTPYRPNTEQLETAPAPGGDSEQADSGPQEQTERPNRNNFVAEARRAAARANQRAANELGPNSINASVLDESQTEAGRSAEKAKTPKMSRMRIAIAAIALAVIGMGATSVLMNMTKSPPSKQEKISTGNPPAKAKPVPGKSAGNGLPVKRAGAKSQTGVPVGVAIEQANGHIPTAVLAHREQQQEAAVLSGQTGASQPTATAIPASLIPQEQPAGRRITGNHNQLSKDMPPALIGPLSLRLAAASGNPSASFEVGARFAEGKGIRQNFKQAAHWYTKAATRGFALAQYRLATLYERGLGVDKDLGRAKIWYERAARQGNVKSMHNLAVLTAGSGAGNSDYGQAARWFGEAANRGLADSQFNLAILYQNGLGVSKDLKQAYQWFGLAARAGDKDADARRKGLISEMKPADLTEADAAIQQWRRKGISRLANDSHYAGLQWKKQTKSKAQSN
ncbi:MAG: tetratricopeptide repeat protein, partial [Pseudomonadota bacterium]